jgi:hypothetical protein
VKVSFVPLVVLAAQVLDAPCLVGQSRVDVWPATVQLDDEGDRVRVTAIAVDEHGASRDGTADARWRVEPASLAVVLAEGERRVVVPLAEGEGRVVAVVGDHEWSVSLRVHEGAARTSFRNGVVPILTRAGCNAGSCHGAAVGKEGFALSLFGYDPARDHVALTRELAGRRVDVAAPERSLILQKATGAVPHKGNRRFSADDAHYRYLREWVADGARDDAGTAPRLVRVEIQPPEAVLVGGGQRLPLTARAHYDDGSDRDVTSWCLWSSSNDVVAAVDGEGAVTAADRGEASVLVRFGGLAVAAQVVVLPGEITFTWPDVAAVDVVDELVHEKLRRFRIAPAALCDDATFVRRVHLDLTNRLPTVDEVRTFVADAAPDKRARLVDDLLARPAFAQLQAMLWADVLRVDAATMEPKGASLLTSWLQDGFAAGRGFDEMVRELLTASGASFSSATVNFHLASAQPHLLAEHAAQNFLGIRLQCAQCHNHPFESWTMDDYYGFAAFFAQTGRKRGEDPYEWVVYDRGSGEVRNARDNSVAAPRLLGAGRASIPAGVDRRRVLADWLTAPANPAFAANVANRVWARLFGRGIVDPVDDVRVGNPPSHPRLLAALGEAFVAGGHDVRVVYRLVCASRTYQQAAAADGVPASLFAGTVARRLSAEQLLDAIGEVTGVPTKYPGVPLGEPATAIARGRAGVRFLDVFGRPARESACTCDRSDEPTLAQALHLLNGDTLAQKIAAREGRLRRAVAAGVPSAAMLEDLFLAAYGRTPRADEAERLLMVVEATTGAPGLLAAWQDVYWAVLNSQEFLCQH